MSQTLSDFEVLDILGDPVSLAAYQGKVLLVVNVASRCGFTGQYAGLQELQQMYADQGFFVLGFPCNQFGSQEPGDNPSVLTFCETTYGVTFPMFAKIDVNGNQASPFYTWLKACAPGVLGTTRIKWNFTKFLVNRDGKVSARYAPSTTPQALRHDIEIALSKPEPAPPESVPTYGETEND